MANKTITLTREEAVAIHTMLLESRNANRTLAEMATVASVLAKKINEEQPKPEEGIEHGAS